MKTLLRFSALPMAFFAIVSFSQSALANNCYCPQGAYPFGDVCSVVGEGWQIEELVPYVCNSSNDTPTLRLSDLHEIDCKPMNNGYVACNHYNETGQLVRAYIENADGQSILSKNYNNGLLATEQTYDEKTKEKTMIFYRKNGTISRIDKTVIGKEYTQEWREYDSNEQLYQTLLFKFGKRYERPWLSQEYKNNQKHGKETEYDINNTERYVIIREANWVNGVKHGEEKFYKPRTFSKPKLIRTVMWNNGTQVAK